jgi:hypothetical protein
MDAGDQRRTERKWKAWKEQGRLLWEVRTPWLDRTEPTHPKWEERLAETTELARAWGAGGDALAEWCGCSVKELLDSVVVHGDCPGGADKVVDEVAGGHGATVRAYPADWHAHGRSAGPRRNRQMATEHSNADALWVFVPLDWTYRKSGSGTSNMIDCADAVKIPVQVIRCADEFGRSDPGPSEVRK